MIALLAEIMKGERDLSDWLLLFVLFVAVGAVVLFVQAKSWGLALLAVAVGLISFALMAL
jgi:hypothetical protein